MQRFSVLRSDIASVGKIELRDEQIIAGYFSQIANVQALPSQLRAVEIAKTRLASLGYELVPIEFERTDEILDMWWNGAVPDGVIPLAVPVSGFLFS